MAYGAYQLAQPRQTLLSSLVQGQFGPSVDTGIKKKKIMDEFREMMERKQKSAQKRSKKWQPLTTPLDFASSFVDPTTAAILGAVSGGFAGYDQMRAAEKLKGAGNKFGQYGFLRPQIAGIKEQIKSQQKDFGDVLISAGTQALSNFAMGKAGQAIKGGVDPLSKAGTTAKPTSTGKYVPSKAAWLDKMKWGEGAIEAGTAVGGKTGTEIAELTAEEIAQNVATLGTMFKPTLEGFTQYGKPQTGALDLSRLY